ncbi:MAG: alpha-glucosidase [Actinophytocola sp.]|uniref:glycoside hydrolase family 97 catalytic domain-containing protein n=1 Tax=Actinophytocola sp. TaxID=1872138 RepID=UPI001323A2FB|nr:glycoside hydrolase family 97 catalytic domain-containing protein [Actinophytocola sp.]MPZ83740.1 alpha-glucosidase [Actinophytocola sp.]
MLSRLATCVTVAAVLVGTAAATPATAAPPQRWTVAAGGLTAQVSLDGGSPRLGVTRHGRQVLAPAPVGLHTTGADLSTGLRLAGLSRRTVTDHYTMTTGKQLRRATRMTELRLSFVGGGAHPGARLDLVVRVAPDGVAYRYETPAEVTITGEASAFTLPADAPAWLLPYNAWYEANRVATTASGAAAGDFGNPSLFQVGDDFAVLTESDVDGRYAGSRLRHAAGASTYQVALADAQVTTRRTPWRTAIIGDLATVTESTLVDDLATPAKFHDTSWVHPGKVAWSWLSEHSSPSNYERQKDFVDFAARNDWPAVLVDEGWSADWVPDLVRYARARGVEILLWFHWNRLDTAEERDTVLPRVRSWGVAGVKLDFMESDTQARYQWYDAVLAKTAELHLMVNFHGSTIPHGLARTWPHLMSMEAVRGAENNPPAVNNPVQAFTRNVVGSMDYTPVSLDVGTKEASVAHEVALPVVYESGWTHLADKPEAYERYPEALRFLDQVPTAWDETRFVAGHPSSGAVLARRSGDRWFVGAISVGDARSVAAPLRFLGGGRWLVEVVQDGSAERGDVVRSTRVLRSSDTLTVDVPRNGGFAAVACRYRPGRTTCDEPLRPVPPSAVTVSPAAIDAAEGTTFEVTGTFTPGAGSVRDVRLVAAAPPGWTVTGPAVTAPRLSAGESITGRWTVTVGSGSGFVDVPVFATYRFDGPQWADRVHVEEAVSAFVPPPPLAGTPYVSDVPFVSETNGWGPVERDRSVNESDGGDGNPLTIGGVVYAKGLGTHAPAELSVYLGGRCASFAALVGLDDETTQPGSVTFEVLADDAVVFDSGVVRPGPAVPVTADTTGARMLTLRVTDGGDGKNFDHADWANALLDCT